jgi:hypothetical protein
LAPTPPEPGKAIGGSLMPDLGITLPKSGKRAAVRFLASHDRRDGSIGNP